MKIGLKIKGPVLFTDHSQFGLHSDSHKLRVWRETDLEAILENVQEVQTCSSGTAMVWAEIRLGEKNNFILLEKFLTAQQYIEEILGPVEVPQTRVVAPRLIFLHDNVRPLVAGMVTQFLEEQKSLYCHGLRNRRIQILLSMLRMCSEE